MLNATTTIEVPTADALPITLAERVLDLLFDGRTSASVVPEIALDIAKTLLPARRATLARAEREQRRSSAA